MADTGSTGAFTIELREDQKRALAEIAVRRGVTPGHLLAEAMSTWDAAHVSRDGFLGLQDWFRSKEDSSPADVSEVARLAVDWWLQSPYVRESN